MEPPSSRRPPRGPPPGARRRGPPRRRSDLDHDRPVLRRRRASGQRTAAAPGLVIVLCTLRRVCARRRRRGQVRPSCRSRRSPARRRRRCRVSRSPPACARASHGRVDVRSGRHARGGRPARRRRAASFSSPTWRPLGSTARYSQGRRRAAARKRRRRPLRGGRRPPRWEVIDASGPVAPARSKKSPRPGAPRAVGACRGDPHRGPDLRQWSTRRRRPRRGRTPAMPKKIGITTALGLAASLDRARSLRIAARTAARRAPGDPQRIATPRGSSEGPRGARPGPPRALPDQIHTGMASGWFCSACLATTRHARRAGGSRAPRARRRGRCAHPPRRRRSSVVPMTSTRSTRRADRR